ncbi:ATP citrate synthase, alpha chain [hydrothermal vent metagenome]|uniref:ATP citrate synthase, alpha chain n=1 Tax=hydrothermal vent metagenome TaxID=652676 RepID=A0A3B1BJU6_9ZZZZ
MAKVLEGPGMEIFNKWGIRTPRHVVISTSEQIESLVQSNQWMRECKMVVKAHEALGSRMKLGLVKIDLDIDQAVLAAKEILGREVHGLVISQVIIAEMLAHDEEYYLAVTSNREGAEILMAKFGGIEVEENWEKIARTFVEVGEKPTDSQLEKCATDAGFAGELIEKMKKFASRLYECYDNEDGNYMEINPLIINPNDGKLCALDAVIILDGDAKFRHPDWNFSFASEFGRSYTEAEEQIMEIDSRVKGSVKLIEIPGGKVALLPAGGGASVFYSDAVIAMGGTIANYSEYSGDPPAWAVEALTDKVCSLPGITDIIVGGAIANFTDVKATFTGIISGFRKAKEQGKLDNVKIWVRRGGPNEAVGLESMRKLLDEGFDIHVYDRYTPLTDIAKFALKGEDN